ncbi:tRNA (guanine-N2-)-methyltransferase [Babesia microti strain RI]|uniref:tRNA (guanine(26)-N(2))-dimethyltransferase n=1 Tax=Babesia microti (strain RI) TaxID=1133968 RepID=A0A1N6LWH5_BABMR|nr:tRNA (guanine-N2-)-methyltransferase [Babesia microti strain RI]SIO73218.1 tRNA (guanine-N2-)-methyltransferase [Babesia microti strain RI]|eukprot:XP_021337326.1 tRNA (guanine-N2-)-methyltransferase [Babesia microti strain RI]
MDQQTDYIEEGAVKVYKSVNGQAIFYNNAQVFNRDISTLSIAAFSKFVNLPNSTGFKVLELFGATGIRGIRYAKELGTIVEKVLINDLDENSANAALNNISLNGVDSKCCVTCMDANLLSHLLSPPPQIDKILTTNPYRSCTGYEYKAADGVLDKLVSEWSNNTSAFLNNFSPTPNTIVKYPILCDIIDLDPYSTASPYLDGALKCVRHGGLLCITSTDMPTLCGNNPCVSFYKYGGIAPKVPYFHELALRILLHAVSTTASKYKRVVIPLMSLSVDFYVRVFVQVVAIPEQCKELANKTGLCFHCGQCDSFTCIPIGNYINGKQKPSVLPSDFSGTCSECGGHIKILGPIYIGELHNKAFVNLCLEECYAFDKLDKSLKVYPHTVTMGPRIRGILTAIMEELVASQSIFYYHLPMLCQKHKLSTLTPVKVKRCLRHLGYTASHFHREPQSIKTNAPSHVLMDILRHHARTTPPKILDSFISKDITTQGINLNLPINPSNDLRKVLKVPRWLPNPEPNWGPKKAHRMKKHVAAS